MSKAQLFWHLAKKDLRYLRWWLAAFYAVLVLNLAMVPVVASSIDERWIMLSALPAALSWLMLLLTQTRLVQQDPILDTSAYAVTRPISRPMLLAGKLGVWLGFLIVPAAGVAVLQVMISGVSLSAGEYAGLLIENLLGSIAEFGFYLLLAALTGKLARLLMVLAVLVAMMVLSMILFQFLNWGIFPMTEQTLVASRDMVGSLSGILLAGTAIWIYYRHRRLWPAAVLGVVLFLARTGVNQYWQYDFVGKHLVKAPSVPEQELPDLAQVEVEFFGKHNFSSFTGNQIVHRNVRMQFKARNLAEPWFLRPTAARDSAAVFADGSRLPSEAAHPMFESVDSGQYARMAFPQFDGGKRSHQYPQATLFSYQTGALKGRDETKATLKGISDFRVARPVVVGEIELKDGAVFDYKNRRYTIVGSKIEGKTLNVRFLTETVEWWLSGNRESLLGSGRHLSLTAVLVNREQGVVLSSQNRGVGAMPLLGNYRVGFGSFAYQRESYFDREQKKSVEPAMDDEFVSGAKLYFVDFEEGGTVSVPFEIPDVELER